ncbi:MAG: prepilin peptidase [Deltaproteobacteria bacterium]|nr:prepilin peptidase [Deltaproteobacteria bacterium]
MPYLLHFYTFFFGLCIGSFLNVCIYRLPLSKSIVRPRSMCPSCGRSIHALDNIPLFSYLILRGKCRHCHTHIPWRYPLVELITGLFAVCVFLKFGPQPQTLIYFLFIAGLLVISFIDIDHKIIPDIISLPGIPIGFAAAFILPDVSYTNSLTGILIGGGSLYAIAWIYTLITKREGMGGGDIKLLAMIGAFIGWQGVIFTIFTASAVGTVVGLTQMIISHGNMKLAIPFGPFLSIGAITYIFFGRAIITWYFGLL